MSDHFSGPAVLGDPAVDITDFYVFPSPERPDRLVLIMNTFPMATPQSLFSDVVTYRFRLRPLTRMDGGVAFGAAEYAIEVSFRDIPHAGSIQQGKVVTSDGFEASFDVGEAMEQSGLRVYAGLVSDPFFMDVEAAIRTDMLGKLSFSKPGVNTVQFRDVLTIVVEVPFEPIIKRFAGVTLMGAVSETVVTRRGATIRLERVGRPEIKNVILASPARDPRATGVELRDLYNREDAFALSPVYRPFYESRLDANLAFFDGLDDATAWPIGVDGRHPLRDLFIDDFLIVDLAHTFAPSGFLEIELAIAENRPHAGAGGRWLDNDILDELLTLIVNGGRGERLGDGVDAPTKPGSPVFPYVREANRRSDVPLPAFLRS